MGRVIKMGGGKKKEVSVIKKTFLCFDTNKVTN